MKKLLLLGFLFPMLVLSQHKLVIDLDGDTLKDTVYINYNTSKIICMLSKDNFKKIESKAIEILNENSSVKATKNGFEFSNHWMRAGYYNQFRYDKKTKQMRLIGMRRYEFGNAANDGSGKSSVNFLTGDYIGNWNYYDELKQELIKIPSIKTKMYFPKIYLEDFSDETYFLYAEKCAALYEKQKTIMINK